LLFFPAELSLKEENLKMPPYGDEFSHLPPLEQQHVREEQRRNEEEDAEEFQRLERTIERHGNFHPDQLHRLYQQHRHRMRNPEMFSVEYLQEAVLESEVFREALRQRFEVSSLNHRPLGCFNTDEYSWHFLKPYNYTQHEAIKARRRRILTEGDLPIINDFFVKLIKATKQIEKFYKYVYELVHWEYLEALINTEEEKEEEEESDGDDSDILTPPPEFSAHEPGEPIPQLQIIEYDSTFLFPSFGHHPAYVAIPQPEEEEEEAGYQRPFRPYRDLRASADFRIVQRVSVENDGDDSDIEILNPSLSEENYLGPVIAQFSPALDINLINQALGPMLGNFTWSIGLQPATPHEEKEDSFILDAPAYPIVKTTISTEKRKTYRNNFDNFRQLQIHEKVKKSIRKFKRRLRQVKYYLKTSTEKQEAIA